MWTKDPSPSSDGENFQNPPSNGQASTNHVSIDTKQGEGGERSVTEMQHLIIAGSQKGLSA